MLSPLELLHRRLTVCLTDSEAYKFIHEYTGARSKKKKAQLVSDVVTLYGTRTTPSSKMYFETALTELIGLYKYVSGGCDGLTPVVRTSDAYPAADWMCVGDSKHWASCLSTRYSAVPKDRRTLTAEAYVSYVTGGSGYSVRDTVKTHGGCNVHRVQDEVYNRQNIVLITLGNPVYVDGDGYVARVRLHHGTVRLHTAPYGRTSNLGPGTPCLIWDRLYGNAQYTQRMWQAAIDYANSLGVLLVTQTHTTGYQHDAGLPMLRVDKVTQYSDYYEDDYCYVRVIASLQDVRESQQQVATLRQVHEHRKRGNYTVSYRRYNCVLLSANYVEVTQYPVDGPVEWPNKLAPKDWSYDTHLPLRCQSMTRKSRKVVVQWVVKHLGYPIGYDTYGELVFKRKPGVLYQGLSQVFLCEVGQYVYSMGGEHLYYDRQTDEWVLVTQQRCYLNEQRHEFHKLVDAFGKLPLECVPYPTHIPGTCVTNMHKRRDPLTQRDFILSLLRSGLVKNRVKTMTWLVDVIYGTVS